MSPEEKHGAPMEPVSFGEYWCSEFFTAGNEELVAHTYEWERQGIGLAVYEYVQTFGDPGGQVTSCVGLSKNGEHINRKCRIHVDQGKYLPSYIVIDDDVGLKGMVLRMWVAPKGWKSQMDVPAEVEGAIVAWLAPDKTTASCGQLVVVDVTDSAGVVADVSSGDACFNGWVLPHPPAPGLWRGSVFTREGVGGPSLDVDWHTRLIANVFNTRSPMYSMAREDVR